jgi:hypothetical protein
MSRFSYSSLSSHDFEELARDLLQAEWGVPLEAFRSGRDKGIDLRYSKPTSSFWWAKRQRCRRSATSYHWRSCGSSELHPLTGNNCFPTNR